MTYLDKWKYTQNDLPIPKEELEKSPTLHRCVEWDGLVIEKGDTEWEACQCFPIEER